MPCGAYVVITRRIIGFGVAPACIDSESVCRMFNDASAGQPRPKHLSTDHDPLFRFHRWPLRFLRPTLRSIHHCLQPI